MPMMDAAASAAWYASAVKVSAASLPISASTRAFRVAAALASRVPHSCSSFSSALRVIEPRLSLRSLAYSGSAALRFSTLISPSRGLSRSLEQLAGVQRRVALTPVAGTQLVGLQRVQHAQHLIDVASHRSRGRRNELDLVVGIDDEGHPVGDTVGVEHSGGLDEFALDVRQHRKGHLLEVFMLRAPLEVDEFAVDRNPQDLRITVLELVVELTERRDLGRAHEGEVLRPEEHHAPLTRVVVTGHRGEVVAGLLRVNLRQIAADQRGQAVGGKLVANCQHGASTPYLDSFKNSCIP